MHVNPGTKSKTSASETIAIFAIIWALIGFFGLFVIGAYFGWLPALSMFLSFGVSAILIWLWSRSVKVTETTNELLKMLVDQEKDSQDRGAPDAG